MELFYKPYRVKGYPVPTKRVIKPIQSLRTSSGATVMPLEKEVDAMLYVSIDILVNFHESVFMEHTELQTEIAVLESYQNKLAKKYYLKAGSTERVNNLFWQIVESSKELLQTYLNVFPEKPEDEEALEKWFAEVNSELPKIIISLLFLFVNNNRYAELMKRPNNVRIKNAITSMVEKLEINPHDWCEITQQ